MAKDWFENDELFFQEAREGHRWQLYVAGILRNHGLRCSVPELRLRESVAEISDFIDSKDLVCEGAVLEVKSRGEPFTCPNDFPYPTVFVDTVSGWEQKQTKPFAYVCVSQLTRKTIWTPGDDARRWVVERKVDRTRGISENFYAAAKALWQSIDSLVGQLQRRKP